MNSTQCRRGRKPKPYVCPWNNETVDGLYRCPDGRWRITATGAKFSESEPRLAVLRFRRWQSRHRGTEAFVQLTDPLDSDETGVIDFVIRHELGPGEHRAPSDETLVLNIPTTNEPITLHRTLPSESIWAHLRDEIIRRPQFVAQMTGIEQIGYLTELPKPAPSPTLEALGDLFFTKKIGADWKGKCRAFWTEFCEVMAVSTVREVTQPMVTAYKDAIEDWQKAGNDKFPDGFGPTFVRQRIEAVKSIINYPPKHRGEWPDDCNRLYGYCKVLMKPEGNRPKPHPISKDHFHRLLAASTDDRLTAGLLTSLNLCMYFGEATRLDWEDVNLDAREVIGNRAKLGSVIRVGVLWERTSEALRKLKPRIHGPIFINDAGRQMSYIDLKRLFDKARAAAGMDAEALRVPQTSDLRDGAYTSAVRAKVGLVEVKMLAGHETGISDQYVLRDPTMVADACAATEKRYFG